MFSEVKDLVVSCMDGFNVCIFAYGQTGSGKTFTMEASVCMTSLQIQAVYMYMYIHCMYCKLMYLLLACYNMLYMCMQF